MIRRRKKGFALFLSVRVLKKCSKSLPLQEGSVYRLILILLFMNGRNLVHVTIFNEVTPENRLLLEILIVSSAN